MYFIQFWKFHIQMWLRRKGNFEPIFCDKLWLLVSDHQRGNSRWAVEKSANSHKFCLARNDKSLYPLNNLEQVHQFLTQDVSNVSIWAEEVKFWPFTQIFPHFNTVAILALNSKILATFNCWTKMALLLRVLYTVNS